MREEHVKDVCVALLGSVAIVALVGTILVFSGKLTLTGAQAAPLEQFCTVHADCPEGYTCQKFTTRPHSIVGKCLPLM